MNFFQASPREKIIVCDVGGTNSRMQLFDCIPKNESLERGEKPKGRLLCQEFYLNQDFSSFDAILTAFLEEKCGQAAVHPAPRVMVVAVAGPVSHNSCVLTNRKEWPIISGELLEEGFELSRVLILNDFVCVGYGVLTLADSEVHVLCDVEPSENEPIACVGAGTGLGECFVTPSKDGYVAFPSEGGHADFAPRTQEEYDMANFIMKKIREKDGIERACPSVENVVSGPGLVMIYEFLKSREPQHVSSDVESNLVIAGDLKASVIADNAPKNKLCRKALELFMSAYGSEVGVAALKFLPTGGLFIAGGIATKNIEFLTSTPFFLEAFRDKGPVGDRALPSIPIKVVNAEDVGLRGALRMGVKLLKDEEDVGGAELKKWLVAAMAAMVGIGCFMLARK